MSVELIESQLSREFSSSRTSATGKWTYTARVLSEVNPEDALVTAVAAVAPFFWYGLARKELVATPQGGGLYTCEVSYLWEVPNSAAQDPTASPGPTEGPGGGSPSGTPTGPSAADAPLGANVSLEIGGRPPKLMQSRSVIYTERAGGGDAPDNMGLLNIEDGKPQGLEVEDPAKVLNVDMQYDYVTMGFVNLLTSACWHTNLSDWYHIPAGCAVFLGATLASTDNGRARASLKFGIRPEQTILTNSLRADAGKELPTADVDLRGWDYLEIDYGDEFDTPSGVRATRPKAMRVHEVLPPFDFSAFGIGV
jgi:hypothetical protein